MADENGGFPDINILLLGERGIGKSTLINSLANYARFNTLKDAEESSDFKCFIRTQVISSTADGEPKILESMTSNMTLHEVGSFQTQEVTSYNIPYEGKVMRLIDTPGITSTKIEDYASCTKILNFIPSLQKIHGVCVLIKPDLARITPDFMYSLLMYITKLGRPVVGNIIFLFTRTRKSSYMALDTISCMRPTLDEIASKEGLIIPLRNRKSERKNCFCFENECFNYLIARAQNVKVNTSRVCLEESWDISKKSMTELFHYITGDSDHLPLEPYILPDIPKIQAVSMLIFEMMTPLIDLAEVMVTNIDVHHMNSQSLEQNSKGKHQKPKVDPTLVPLVQVITGTALKTIVATCVKCLTDCPLQDIQDDPTCPGDTNVRISDSCKTCYCGSTTHLMRYYDIQKINASSVNVVNYEDYVNEYHSVITGLAYFADYFVQHASRRIKDVYEQYIQGKINMGKTRNKEIQVRRYTALLKAYNQSKKTLSTHPTPDVIISYVEYLKNNKHIGVKIAELHSLLHPKQQEQQQAVPMEIDQDIPISTIELGQEPLNDDVGDKQRITVDPVADEDDEKRQVVIQLLMEKKDKEAWIVLNSLLNNADKLIPTFSKDNEIFKEVTETANDDVFHDALQSFDMNLFDPKSNVLCREAVSCPAFPNDGLAKEWKSANQGPITPHCYFQGSNQTNNSRYPGTAQVQFNPQSITPQSQSSYVTEPSRNQAQPTAIAGTKSQLYPCLPKEHHHVAGKTTTRYGASLPQVHDSSKAVSNKSYALVAATNTRQGQSDQCEIKPDVYVNRNKNKNGTKSKMGKVREWFGNMTK